MSDIISLGLWIKRRRKALDLTQDALARRVGCSLETIRKIEADARRPSRQIAERLAEQLGVPLHEQAAFIGAARGELGADRLAPPQQAAGHSAFAPAPTLPRPADAPRPTIRATNLPTLPTALIGRAAEIAQISTLLRSAKARLVTLTGPGGTGKTRLGLHVAGQLLGDYPDGVWLVELAPLTDPARVVQAIAETLEIREEPTRPLRVTLNTRLREKRLLLVLDNCEHLIGACAQAAETLLQACPPLHILASSREPLGIAGEAIVHVPPLAVPDPHEMLAIDQLMRYEAVQLFVARALAVQPAFILTSENAPAIVQLCHRLDGLPLAIELAAARARVLAIQQIAARLDDRFRLLTGGSRTAMPRHQTLRALIDWSYDLLSEGERTLLRRLAVFMGSWTVEAAEAVCGAPSVNADQSAGSALLKERASVLDRLTQLVDKSLVLAGEQLGTARYHMLETIRQYALEKLESSGEANALRRRHALYYLERAEANYELQQEATGYAQLEAAHDNLRAALQWALEQPDVEIAVRLACALGWFWYRRGYWTDGRSWPQLVLARLGAEENVSARAWLLFIQGILSQFQGDTPIGQALLEESLALSRKLGDTSSIGTLLLNMGIVARERGDAARATALFEESLAIKHRQDDRAWVQVSLAEVAIFQENPARASELLDPSLARFRELGVAVGVAWALNHLGHVAQLEGDYGRAAALHRESLPLFQDTDQLGVGWALEGLGEAALAQGDAVAAATHFAESLRICQILGDPASAWSLAGLASVAAQRGQAQRAARLWGAAEALREAIGKRVAPASRAAYEPAVAAARVQLGENAFAAAWAAGRALSLEAAIAEALTPS